MFYRIVEKLQMIKMSICKKSLKRQEDLEFKVSLGYIVNSRPTWAI
jgi:hypothetical protein